MSKPDPKAVRANWKSLCTHVNNLERCLLQLCAHPATDPDDLTKAITHYRATLQMMQETLPMLEQKLPTRPAPFGIPWEFASISGRAWRVKR
jgi:hypothetical protein